MLLTFTWSNTSFVYEDEYYLTRLCSYVKTIVLGFDEKPNRNEFLFISISYDKQLEEKLDDDGMVIGEEAITDRRAISDFLKLCRESGHGPKYVILDVFFQTRTNVDSALQSEISKFKNLIIPYNQQDGKFDYPIMKAKWGLATDEKIQEGFLGISSDAYLKLRPIMFDTAKMLSLKMYEQLQDKNTKPGWLWNYENGKPVYKSCIPSLPIRSYDLFLATDNLKYDFVYMDELLYTPKEIVGKLISNRIIVIGDFNENDMHETIYGDMPGPLILTNEYLALRNGEHYIRWFYLLFLFGGFFLVSHHKLFPELRVQEQKGLASFIRSLCMFTLFSIASYFLFNKHIAVLFLSLYFDLLERAKKFILKFTK